MSDPTIDMNSRATRGAIPYLGFFALLIVLQIWREPIMSRVVDVFGGDYATFEQTEKMADTASTVIAAILLSILLFFSDLNIHNILDDWTFRTRKRVETIIKKELALAAAQLKIEGADQVLSNSGRAMRIFYHFANAQVALRERAFMLWGRYFRYLNVLFFGLLSLAITTVAAFQHGLAYVSAAIPIVIILFLATYSLSIWTGLVPKIKGLPKQQVEEIRIHAADELRREIEQRRQPVQDLSGVS